MTTTTPQQEQVPTKVCMRCGVQSRTESDRCPACGKPYRRRLTWLWIVLGVILFIMLLINLASQTLTS